MAACWTRNCNFSLYRALRKHHRVPLITCKLPFCIRSSSSSSPAFMASQTGSGSSVKRRYDGFLLDAGGTLLQLAKPVEETYAEIGKRYGLTATTTDIKQGFKRAFSAPWPEKLRYQNGPVVRLRKLAQLRKNRRLIGSNSLTKTGRAARSPQVAEFCNKISSV